MTSPPLYLKWHPPYLCHHNHSIAVLRPTVCMTSHPLYVCHLMHSTQRHIHSLWIHTIVVITLHPLHSWHYTPYIWHHTHGNTNVISAIWPTISNTTSTLSVSSNPGYQLYHTHSLYDITHTVHVTSYSVCLLSQQLFMTLYTSMYNIIPSIFMTSYPICMLSPYCFHDNTTTIPDMSPTIFDITATVSVSSHRWHTHLYRCIALSMTSQVCQSSHLAHVWHHTQSTSHHIYTLWDQWSCFMTSQTLHSWHQISSIWHHIHGLWHVITYTWDITATISVTSPPLWLWIHNHYIWHKTHRVKTIQPLCLTSHPPYLYLCDHTHYIDDITHTVCRASHILYVWHYMHYIWHHIQALWHSISLFMTSNLLYLTSHPLYLTAHPLYLCHHTQIIDLITPILCMIPQPQYI